MSTSPSAAAAALPTLLLTPLLLACGDSPAAPGGTDTVHVGIEGAESVELDCDAKATATYEATGADGVSEYRWQVTGPAGTRTGSGRTFEVLFSGAGEYEIRLEAVVTGGSSGTATQRAVARLPADLGRCFAESWVNGPTALHTLPQGFTVRREYQLALPAAVESLDSAIWMLEGPSASGEASVVSSSNLRAVEIPFAQVGEHRVSVRLVAGAATHTLTVDVTVRSLAEAGEGVVLFFSENRDPAGTGVYLMSPDGQAVVGPVLTNPLLSTEGASCEPDGSRISVSYAPSAAATPCPDIYIVSLDSDGSVRIVESDGCSQMPDWSAAGEIAFVDDTRWSGESDYRAQRFELIVVRPDGSGLRRLAGDALDPTYHGIHPAWDPTGSRIALGSASFESESGEAVRRVAIYEDLDRPEPTRRRLHPMSAQQAYGIADETGVVEGTFGTAWSPDGQWVAYHFDDGTGPGIARAAADGSGQVEIVVRDGTLPAWSADSRHILFRRLDLHDDVLRQHTYSVPAAGGTPVDLSARTNAGADDVVAAWCDW